MRLFALVALLAVGSCSSLSLLGCLASTPDEEGGDPSATSALAGVCEPPAGAYHVTFETVVAGECGDLLPRDVELTADAPWIEPPYSLCDDGVSFGADVCDVVDVQTCKTLTPDGAVEIDSRWTYELEPDGASFAGTWSVTLSSASDSTSCSYKFSATRE